MKLFWFVCLFAICTLAREPSYEAGDYDSAAHPGFKSENAKLRKTNEVLVQTLKELAIGSQAEAEVGSGSSISACTLICLNPMLGVECAACQLIPWMATEEHLGSDEWCEARYQCLIKECKDKTRTYCMQKCPKSLCQAACHSDSDCPANKKCYRAGTAYAECIQGLGGIDWIMPGKSTPESKMAEYKVGGFSCSQWCSGGGHGKYGQVIGTAPFCNASCNSCPNGACTLATSEMSDYGSGCATGNKVCCCSS